MIIEPIWGLSAHQHSFFQEFLKYCDIRGKDVLELGGAMPSDLVIEYLGANSWTCVQSADYEAHRSDNQKPSPEKNDGRYRPVWANAEDFLESTKEQWDIVFSIAAFEHVLKLPTVARLLPKVLKVGGSLFSIFAPIWSGPWGQHFTDSVPERFGRPHGEWTTQLIFNSPWDHLIYGTTEYLEIYTAKFDREFAEELTYQTYQSPQINRLHFEDYSYLFKKINLFPKINQGIFDIDIQHNTDLMIMHNKCKNKYQGQIYRNFTSSGIALLLLQQ